MAKNAFYAQSGGVTAVINASACGVIQAAKRTRAIGKVFAGKNGIIGALKEELIDTSKESAKDIAALKYTPSGAFGSCRYKLKSVEDEISDLIIQMEKMKNIDDIKLNFYKLISKTCLIYSKKSTINDIYVDEKVEDYVLNLVFSTRSPSDYGLEDLSQLIEFGASPRATINLILASKARAFLEHRGYITPEDVRYVGKDILRHRIILTYEAEAEELSSEDVIQRLFDSIEIP